MQCPPCGHSSAAGASSSGSASGIAAECIATIAVDEASSSPACTVSRRT